jgi:hypothetical protein
MMRMQMQMRCGDDEWWVGLFCGTDKGRSDLGLFYFILK